MDTYPDWVLGLSEAELERRFGHHTLARGLEYASDGRVSSVRRSGHLVMAQVRGTTQPSYQTSVVCQAGPASLVATCTCLVRRDCKHAAALLLHLRTQAQGAHVPHWQRALGPLLSRPSAGRGGVRLALQLNETSLGFTLRPLRRGTREQWVKAGATWDDIRFDRAHELNPVQRDALVALLSSRRGNDYAYGHRSDALPLSELRQDLWDLLAQALASGVELLAGEDAYRRPLPKPVLLEEPLVPTVLVDGAAQGIALKPVVRARGESFALPARAYLGRPAHGAAFRHGDEVLLGALERPLDDGEQSLFAGTGPVSVPTADLALFAAGFLPHLRRRLAVDVAPGVILPEPAPPTLVCRVEFAERTASVRWAFRYTVAGEVRDVGLAFDPTDPPVRDPGAEAELAASVPAGPWAEDAPGGTELRPAFLVGRPLFHFVTEALPALSGRDDVDVVLNDRPPLFREADEAPTVTLSVTDSDAGDWFNLGVTVSVAGEDVPFALLFTALSVGDDHLLLDSGTWFSLAHPELDQLRALIEEARVLVDSDGDSFRLRPEHAGLWEELVSIGVVAEQSAAWEDAVGALLDLDELPDVAVPAGLRAGLRPYQHTGFRWLSFLWRTRLGGVLADEMGLGKTLQSLALAQAAHEAGELRRPMLVVAPTTVVGTWASEAARFVPGLRVVTIAGTAKRRGAALAEAVADADLVLTSYTLLRLEADAYAELEWSAVLLDEAQFVKNHRSQAYHAVRRLRARVKVALTGTPLENNLMDLWSLLSITAPGLFPDPKRFTEVFRKPIENGEPDALERLHRRIRPLILRRTKAAVAAELPPKQEQVVPVELSPSHRRLYDKHLARERQKVLGLVDDLHRNRLTILRSLTLLRQLSLSPALVEASYPAHSAKLDTLAELLHEVVGEGHRALVFSQFTSFLALVRDRLAAEGIAYEYLDGRTRDRAAPINAFRTGDAPVFLISLKAGGFGLTLTEADYVFILDPWWNPAAETQAIDRTHRIGQDKPVNVYRLVAADTIEEKVVALQERKRHLFDQVVGAASDIAAPLGAADIRALLEP